MKLKLFDFACKLAHLALDAGDAHFHTGQQLGAAQGLLANLSLGLFKCLDAGEIFPKHSFLDGPQLFFDAYDLLFEIPNLAPGLLRRHG